MSLEQSPLASLESAAPRAAQPDHASGPVTDGRPLNEQHILAYVMHELRNPLTNLKMRLYLAHKHPENMEQHLRIMDEVTEHMRCLVEDLLDSARISLGSFPLNRQAVDLRDLIAHATEMHRPAALLKLIRLSSDCPEYPVNAVVDPNRITQVLGNLIANAINYTGIEGEISVQLFAEHGGARLYVNDNGIGIPRETLAHLFEPFVRGNNHAIKGSGLGLSIAKAIVEQHGGTLTVVSRVGRGSVFSILLPTVPEPSADEPARYYEA